MLSKKEKKFFYIINITLLIIVVVVQTCYRKNFISEYSVIDNSTVLKDRVIRVETNHDVTYLVLARDKRKLLIPPSANFIYPSVSFSENVLVGDSLFKNSNSDTLYLVKKEQKFMFRISESLNTPDWRNR